MSGDKDNKKHVKNKRVRWKAGKTSMSNLTKEERKKRLGLIPSDEELNRMKKREKKSSELTM